MLYFCNRGHSDNWIETYLATFNLFLAAITFKNHQLGAELHILADLHILWAYNLRVEDETNTQREQEETQKISENIFCSDMA